MSKITARSIWFVSCVLIGLLLGHLDGLPPQALAKTGLTAAVLFVVFLVGESVWKKYQK